MNQCNVVQNEKGGKDLLLKACMENTGTTAASSTTLTTGTAHGAVIGDLVHFLAVGANTSVDVDGYYFVKTVPTSTTMTISLTPGGSAISFDGIATAVAIEVFQAVGGLRSKSFSFSADGIEITNQDSQEWQTFLDGAGIRSVALSGSGVYNTGAVLKRIRQQAFLNQLTCLMIIEVVSGLITVGCFKVTSLEISGDYDAEGEYSIGADSSGLITVIEGT